MGQHAVCLFISRHGRLDRPQALGLLVAVGVMQLVPCSLLVCRDCMRAEAQCGSSVLPVSPPLDMREQNSDRGSDSFGAAGCGCWSPACTVMQLTTLLRPCMGESSAQAGRWVLSGHWT